MGTFDFLCESFASFVHQRKSPWGAPLRWTLDFGRLPCRRIRRLAADQQIDAVGECLAVAQGVGVRVPGDPWAAVERIALTMPEQRSSTAQDLARGKRSEIDELNGYVLRQGQALGIATPVNRALHALVRLLEAR